MVDLHYSDLPRFSGEAFRFFLPTYMLRGLRSKDEPWAPNQVVEFTVFSLLPKRTSKWWLSRVAPLTQQQRAAVAEFLRQTLARYRELVGEEHRGAAQYWGVALP
jgi:hypothetical protein